MTTVTKENAVTREIFRFRFDDVKSALVLMSYEKHTKIYPKKKFSLVCSWSVCAHSIPENEIPLTEEIKQDALNLFISNLRVITRAEFLK
jgi:hypothetical protein